MNHTTTIDTADTVLHAPSGEEWLVAAVENEFVYWAGYPFGGRGNLADCQLVRKATDEERTALLYRLTQITSSARPVILARQRFMETHP